MYDFICISDLHLGAKNCENNKLRKFLHKIRKDKILTKCLIIAGDGFDVQKESKITRKFKKTLKQIKKLSKKIPVIWLTGNHDPDYLFTFECTGIIPQFDLIVKSGDKNIFITHGHIYDNFLDKHPIITNIADFFYNISQKVDNSHRLAKILKKQSKQFLKVAKKIGFGIVQEAKDKGCSIAIHGHNHNAGHTILEGVDLWDCGCWTEKPCTYLSILNGKVKIHEVD